MKKIIKLSSLALAVVMALSLAACGKKDDPKKLIEESLKATEALSSYDATMDMDMNMEVSGQKMDTKVTMNMSVFNKPTVKVKASANTEVAGQSMIIEMYTDENFMYMNQAGQWLKMPITDAIAQQQNQQMQAQDNMKLYMQNFKNFKTVGEEKVGDVDTYKIEGVISAESIKEQLASSMDMFAAMGLDPTTSGMMEEMFKKVGDVPTIIWVDKNSKIAMQYEMDMTNLMLEIIKSMDEIFKDQLQGQSLQDQIKFGKYIAKMTMTNMDKAADFEIPAEALSAETTDMAALMPQQ